jgi:hypothetical protein
MTLLARTLGLAAILAAAVSLSALMPSIPPAFAEEPESGAAPMSGHAMPGHRPEMAPMTDHAQHMMEMHGQHAAAASATRSAPPGQDAFGAIQEIVRLLEADPRTDWSKVKLGALRAHLVDMSEVTLKAAAEERKVEGGPEIAVTGSGRTLAAIRRMIPAHAAELDGLNGWRSKSEAIPNGVRLTVLASDAKEVRHIQGLGFIGLLVSGAHHQPHHLAMAKGEFTH